MSSEQLPHLETFLKVADQSSFTAAAQALGLTQAAVSQRIHALEGALGLALFRRSGGRVLLTDAGQRLHPYAQRILALHQEARVQVTRGKSAITGELALGASSIPSEHLLPAILSNFQTRYPHVQVRSVMTHTRDVLRQLELGQIQLGMVGRREDGPHLDYRCLGADELVLVVLAEHSWGRRRRVSLAELCHHPLILCEPGSGSRNSLEQALVEAGRSLDDFDIVAEVKDSEAVKEAVLRGLGGAVLSTAAVKQELKAGQLHALQINDLSLKREMFAVRDQRRVLSVPAQLFLDLAEAGT
jgi:DNA-binding transcriptional LysR family regulator